MRYLRRDLLTVTEGVIAHQVNCRNRIGGGVSGAIIRRYPAVAEDYHRSFREEKAEALFGSLRLIPVTDRLTVANLYTQMDYGNPARTGRVYTDAERLAACLARLCADHQAVYVPYLIGCGLGGERWDRVAPLLAGLPQLVVCCLPGEGPAELRGRQEETSP